MTRSLRLGLHASNPSLLALSKTRILQQRFADQDVAIEWVRLPTGPRAVDYIGANRIDVFACHHEPVGTSICSSP